MTQSVATKPLTDKQEGFILDCFNGTPPGQSYMNHYHVKSMAVADASASRLLKNAKMQVRLSELRQATEDATVATVLERKQVATEVIRGRFADFMVKPTAEKLKSAALQEIRVTGEGESKVTTIKLHDPMKAIDLLNKMDGIYTPDGATTINQDNRTVNINVTSEAAKQLTESIVDGRGTD